MDVKKRSTKIVRYILVLGIVGGMLLLQNFSGRQPVFEQKDKLSEYGFFQNPLADLNPVQDVIPYDLNTPLFSNYAEKLRFVKVPPGEKVKYNDSLAFEFPVGTILIKNFLYYTDFRKKEKGRRILETRLLVHERDGWNAYPYIWNEEQTEAFYDPAGEAIEIKYTDHNGKKVTTSYLIPNKNQCKGCHIRGEEVKPIGPTARNLNKDHLYTTGLRNQLVYWKDQGVLQQLPEFSFVPKLPVWNDPQSGDLDSRARAYLEVNCGHCHNRRGPASTSGLFLDIYEHDKGHFGINKAPVAAGRGAGNMEYDIMPGQPSNSILIFRMKTNDPAIAMPEIGREQVHKEGVALIEEWIKKMPL